MKVGEVREGYIALWKKYPTDEVKFRVVRPSVLGPSKILLRHFLHLEEFEREYNAHPKLEARKIAWKGVRYEERFREEMKNPLALKKILEITALVLNGKNVRLIYYEKEPPCHRFILKDIIEEKVSIAKKTIEQHVALEQAEIKKHANGSKAGRED